MSSSQYTVHVAPEFQENGEQSVRRTLDVSELPKVLKIGLRCSARRNPKFATLTFFCAGGLGSFQMFTYITGSPIIGAVLAVLMFAAGLGSILMPDFSKGIFLDMLLDDKEHTKKIAASAKTATIFSSALFDFGFIPIITYFLIVPMASTDLLGPHTSIVTPVLWSITCFSLIPSIFFDLSANLGLEIGRVWDWSGMGCKDQHLHKKRTEDSAATTH